MMTSITPSPLRDRSKSIAVTSILGSQRRIAAFTAVSIRPTVSASIVSNTRSWISQPNSGRIGRSPGAVPRITVSACSMSSRPPTSASAPRWLTVSGNAKPEPRMSDFATCSPKRDHRPADLHSRAGELDLRAAAFQCHCGRALDLDLRLALDRHVLPVDLKRLGRLERCLAGGFVRPVLLVLLLHVVGDLDLQLAAARQ